jgi:hypothetical protein
MTSARSSWLRALLASRFHFNSHEATESPTCGSLPVLAVVKMRVCGQLVSCLAAIESQRLHFGRGLRRFAGKL